jgi:polyphosphate kinase 2 (PPK2 family)
MELIHMAKKPRSDGHPKLKRKPYETQLRQLQAELCALQAWVKVKGLRIIIVFEGRDCAGKGGTIKAITERVSPRVFRVVALSAPSDREKSQMYVGFGEQWNREVSEAHLRCYVREVCPRM